MLQLPFESIIFSSMKADLKKTERTNLPLAICKHFSFLQWKVVENEKKVLHFCSNLKRISSFSSVANGVVGN